MKILEVKVIKVAALTRYHVIKTCEEVQVLITATGVFLHFRTFLYISIPLGRKN